MAAISYHLSFPAPATHYLTMEMRVEGLPKEHVNMVMPVWTPGSYLVREYSKNVESFSANNANGQPLDFKKTSKNTWQINKGRNEVLVVRYEVYCFEYTVRTSHITEAHAALTPASIFMTVEGLENQPVELHFDPPKRWKKLTTALSKVNNDPFHRKAQHFDELVDSPIEIGNHQVFEFEAAGIPHQVAMIGEANYDQEQLKKDMTAIVEETTAIFGFNPCRHYTFFIHHTHKHGGGLEHMNSTALMIPRQFYLDEEQYKVLLRLVAHEYFHLWNVRRLRPGPFVNVDYTIENYTALLWVAEGFTSYYDEMILQRTGHFSTNDYLEKLASAMNEVTNTPGNHIQSTAESSFDAWIKYYRKNENTNNAVISYYTRGQLIAACLDLQVIKATEGERSLDDVLQELYQTQVRNEVGGYTKEDVENALEKVSGRSFTKFIDKHVYGLEPLPFKAIFKGTGIKFSNKTPTKKARLGIEVKEENGSLWIKEVMRGTSAWRDGLSARDELIAIDGMRVDSKLLDLMMDKAKPGDTLTTTVSREGVLRTIKVKLKKDTRNHFQLKVQKQTNQQSTKIYQKWLKQSNQS